MGLLLFCLTVIVLGIIAILLWPILLLIWYIILLIGAVAVGSWAMAIVLTMGNYMINGNVWEGFNDFWIASVVVVAVCYAIAICIEMDLLSMADGISLRRGKHFLHFKKKK